MADFLNKFLSFINTFIDYIKELVSTIRAINDGKEGES